ncbi:MAG: Secretion system C-terminal sorting domain [Bacteroidota bacterium]|jgi:hypothetical protein
MKKLLFFVILLSNALVAIGQTPMYGTVRKNYFTTIVDPFDSTNTFQQFDSATFRLGLLSTQSGFVANVGNTAYTDYINLTGAALNPYDLTFNFIGATSLNVMDLISGDRLRSLPLTNPLGQSYYDNFRFNNADSSLYGLARRNIFDPVTQSYTGQMYLAKLNTLNGVITQISPSSIGQGFALAGSAIDPYQMVFYYSTGASLMGIDMYTGLIYSNAQFQITDGFSFDNFTYSCADTAIYGLVRNNYFSYIVDSLNPNDSIQVLDSSAIRLGKINPATGVVTNISPYSIMPGGYSLNVGSAIDPSTMTYYFSNGFALVGVSLYTGLVTSTHPFSFADGDYFDLMRNTENCIAATALRNNPLIAGINSIGNDIFLKCYPNPANTQITLVAKQNLTAITIYNNMGVLVLQQDGRQQLTSIDVSTLVPGIYTVLANDGGRVGKSTFVISR